MKDYSLNKLRHLTVILALSGMTFGIFIPAISDRRAAASENFSKSEPSAPTGGLPKQPTTREVEQSLENMPVYFEENRGQQDKRVKYLTRGGGTEMFLTATEAVYVIRRQDSRIESQESKIDRVKNPALGSRLATRDSKAVAVYMRLAGANEQANFAPSQELAHRTNYFKGSNPENWQTEIPNYQRITAENIYDGIDMVWQCKEQGRIQYDFVVQPETDPNVIEWEIEGADNVSLDAEGGLVIETEAGVMKQSKPFTFQETEGLKSVVSSQWSVIDSLGNGGNKKFTARYILGEYDRAKPLTIDPLAYSTFVGGSSLEVSHALALDPAGNTYITGFTFPGDFPTTPGAFDTTLNGQSDRFVTKLNAAGSALVYSTFIGGLSFDGDLDVGIAIDSTGNVYLSGNTLSTSYPTTVGAFDTTHNGFDDVYVTKLNAAGSNLVYSTFIGGSRDDRSANITVDSNGNAYLTGVTDKSPSAATDYPTTVGAFDTSHNGLGDAFVTKLNAAGSSLVYSTFIGGNEADQGFDIAIDSSGNAFVTGFAFTNFPTTAGAFDTSHNGDFDVFAAKLNASGSDLVYSTYIGGSVTEVGNAIAIDSSGSAYLTGSTGNTLSTPYPTTPGAFDTTLNGNADVIVTKLNAAGSALVYSTLIGGGGSEVGRDIAVDSAGNAYLTGSTSNFSGGAYPVTPGAFNTTHNGAFGDVDGFVTKLNATGATLDYSSFIGGAAQDIGFGIVVVPPGTVYLTGSTTITANPATDFPTTAGAFDTTHNGDQDAFVTRLELTPERTPFDFDGDGRADISVFRPNPDPSNNYWYVLQSSDSQFRAFEWGIQTDTIAPADYDGDGKTDYAVWREATGVFYIYNSSNGTIRSENFGLPGDKLTVGDWDGDGKADPSTYRDGAQSIFFYRGSLNNPGNNITYLPWGVSGDKPQRGDFDGDGKLDVAVFRPSDAVWYIRQSSNSVIRYDRWGLSTDKFVPYDYDGDGKTDLSVFRNGIWYVLQSSIGQPRYEAFGISTDTPVPADYDGDGKSDIAVFRPSSGVWYRLNSSNSVISAIQFGLTGDTPIPALP